MLEVLLIANWPWRLVNKRRTLFSETENHINSMYNRMVSFQKNNSNPCNDQKEVLKNYLSMLKDEYWDVSTYEQAFNKFIQDGIIDWSLASYKISEHSYKIMTESLKQKPELKIINISKDKSCEDNIIKEETSSVLLQRNYS
ncbi:MAG: hypothetical protein KJ583_00105 [Nanoarchaeota archaeon]|nr:hypothetical protein [Nanoarchaeota archaeon]MBU1270477.1 hypothetical protein [Nanoarchaeota archaeon]MBU1603690.1 hypothetical protein [Nanoarchaeota archaeon]MBU2443715.1 hypothetical protein [Nanoarchaeota archaeon]